MRAPSSTCRAWSGVFWLASVMGPPVVRKRPQSRQPHYCGFNARGRPLCPNDLRDFPLLKRLPRRCDARLQRRAPLSRASSLARSLVPERFRGGCAFGAGEGTPDSSAKCLRLTSRASLRASALSTQDPACWLGSVTSEKVEYLRPAKLVSRPKDRGALTKPPPPRRPRR